MSSVRACLLIALVAPAVAGLPGCSQTLAPVYDVGYQSKDNLAALDRVFRLGVGDKLKIDVFGEQELSGEVEIGASGNVSLPLLGEVPAKGKTVEEFSQGLRTRLQQGYLKSPKLSVQVQNYRPIYVQGEVRHGGEFPYKPGLSIADAIALAGGYTYRAVEGSIVLRRQGEALGRRIPVDGTIPVLPGDNLQVEERFF